MENDNSSVENELNLNVLKPYVVVFGNEKGGTGKSTIAINSVIALLSRGFLVGTIDLDARQGTFSRYVENRAVSKKNKHQDILMPEHIPVFRSELQSKDESEKEDEKNFLFAYEKLASNNFIIIDTPGSDIFLSRLGHSFADTIVTPINDSFFDLDMLVKVDKSEKISLKPSKFSEMVWEQKKRRAIRDGGLIEWIVLRNRMSNLFSKNKAEVLNILNLLSKRIGFKMIHGFSERVIFREMFLSGLTLTDIKTKESTTLSHIAARKELEILTNQILENYSQKAKKLK